METYIDDAVEIERLFKRFREINETYKPDLDKIDEAFVQKLWHEQRFFRYQHGIN